MSKISDIRQEYSSRSLTIGDVKANPIDQFNQWFEEAREAKVTEVNAMSLATATNGLPSNRIVLLKEVDEGFVFYTNYQSQKGKELAANPLAALTFFWPELERQVRVQGQVEKVSKEMSLEYFQSRPRGSQIGAWASPQSSVLKDRGILESREKELHKRFEGQDKLPKPEQWGGYRLLPFTMEFWQGRPSRLHDRICYTFIEGSWRINRLAP